MAKYRKLGRTASQKKSITEKSGNNASSARKNQNNRS